MPFTYCRASLSLNVKHNECNARSPPLEVVMGTLWVRNSTIIWWLEHGDPGTALALGKVTVRETTDTNNQGGEQKHFGVLRMLQAPPK